MAQALGRAGRRKSMRFTGSVPAPRSSSSDEEFARDDDTLVRGSQEISHDKDDDILHVSRHGKQYYVERSTGSRLRSLPHCTIQTGVEILPYSLLRSLH